MYRLDQIVKINHDCSNGFSFNCTNWQAKQLFKVIEVNEKVRLKAILENSYIKEGESWVIRPTLILFKEEKTSIDGCYNLSLAARVPEDYTVKTRSINTLKKLSKKYTDDSILELAGYKKKVEKVS